MSESQLESGIVQPKKHKNLISRLWNGEITLWKTYWLYGTVGNLVLRMASPALTYLLLVNTDSLSIFDTNLIIYSFLAFYAIYDFVVLVGIWRSADKYRASKPQRKGYGTLAKVMAFFGFFSLLSALIQLAAPESKHSLLQPKSADEQLQIDATLAGLNRNLPKMVDNITRLEKIDFKDNGLIYYMTISKDIAEKNAVIIKLRDSITQNICRNSEIYPILKSGSNIIYRYSDSENKLFAEIVIKKADCPNL